MSKPKILYISQEIAPYLSENELSTYSRDLPQEMQNKGYEVRTFMPKYGIINERRNQLHEVIRLSGMNIIIDDADHPLIIKVATLLPSRMQVYFIDNDDYFQRHNVSDIETRLFPEDNDERIMFYIRGVIETVKKLKWSAAIIQNTGWITSLAPLYLKKQYHDDPAFSQSKIVYALFNDKFEGTLDSRFVEKLKMSGFDDEHLTSLLAGPVDYIALNKLAIDHSDAIAVASEGVEPELIEYARNSGKPFLEYPGAENRDAAFADFYASLQK
ncbi:MAG: glycogen/starch synthase [Muribaculaceae bacterium]|nr:glycogen/starch synthase [Muribaculaceae bacterium]